MGRRRLRATWLVLLATSPIACGSTADGPQDESSDEAGAGGVVASGSGGSATGGAGHAATGGKAGAGGAIGTGGKAGTGGALGTGGASQTGGASGTGGAQGTGGTPLTVLACNSLPAAGKWESINPPGVHFTNAVVADPFDAGTVWLGADGGGFYKSTDCGATWTHVNTGRNSADAEKGGKVSMALDPVDRGVMYSISLYGAQGLWKTTNGGVDWDQLFPSTSEVAKTVEYNFIDSISMDPTDHRHLVVGTHGQCAAPYDPTCEAESTDAGATWRIFKQPGTVWQEQAGPFVIGGGTWVYGAPSGLYLTTDHGASWQTVTPSGASAFGGGEVENHGISRAADGTYYLTSYTGIVKSSDGHSWSLIPSSGGRTVGFVIGGGHMYSSDQWSATYHVASETDPTKWSSFPPPAALPSDQGAPFLDYDQAHHILYSSNFAGGLWRVVTE